MGAASVHQKVKGDRRSRSRWFLGPPLLLWAALLLVALPAQATFHEQLAIDAKAISLANTVTADPPGLLSIHYNPAGLCKLPEGNTFSNGLTVPIIKKTSKFELDPEFEGFLGNDPADDPVAGEEGTNSAGRMYIPLLDQTVDFLVSPTLGVSTREPGSRWTFALGQYAPFAVGLVHDDDDDPARWGGKSVYQQHLIYAAPAVGYRLHRTFSVGLSVGMGQTAMGAEVDMRAPNDIVALTRVLGETTEDLEVPVISEMTLPPPWFGGGISPYDQVATFELSLRDDFSPSYNVGFLYEPFWWFSLGAVYQSGGEAELTGHYRFEYSEAWQQMVDWMGSSPLLVTASGMFDLPMNSVPSQSGTATTTMTFPQRVQGGIKLKPFHWLSLLGDLQWADWSVVDEDRIEFDQDIQLLKVVKMIGYTGGDDTLVIERDFKDTWTWSVGLEIQPLDWLFLRCGYERRESSVQTKFFDLLYALPDLDNYGAGIGIKLKNGTELDLAFGYIVSKGYKVSNNGSSNLNSTEFTDPVYNPYAGLDYEQDTITYMGSFKLQMPTTVLGNTLHHTMDALKTIGGWLNPFD
jgi:long-subunit fatty acid transport protein